MAMELSQPQTQKERPPANYVSHRAQPDIIAFQETYGYFPLPVYDSFIQPSIVPIHKGQQTPPPPQAMTVIYVHGAPTS